MKVQRVITWILIAFTVADTVFNHLSSFARRLFFCATIYIVFKVNIITQLCDSFAYTKLNTNMGLESGLSLEEMTTMGWESFTITYVNVQIVRKIVTMNSSKII